MIHQPQQIETFKMPFGKNKGKLLSELEPQYLNFLLNTDWFSQKDLVTEYIKQNDIQLVLSFGKHKGKYINEILNDGSYCKFLQDNNIVNHAFF